MLLTNQFSKLIGLIIKENILSKIGIDWTQASTWKGLVWLIVGIIGVYYTWGTKDITQLLAIGSTIVGSIGLGVKD